MRGFVLGSAVLWFAISARAAILAGGDLYAVVAVTVPTALDADEKKLWEQLASESRFNPRE